MRSHDGSKFVSLFDALRDGADILRHARNPTEVLRALVPASMRTRRVLNDGAVPMDVDAKAIAKELRAVRNRLKLEAIDDGGHVHYGQLRGGATYRELEKTSRGLAVVSPADLETDAERIAFFVNLYNVLAIHGVLALGLESSVMEVPSFFGSIAYRVGGFLFTLDDVENGVLRRNAPHPVTKTKQFPEGAGELEFCPSVLDPRIHTALVCASKSCPPVAFYDAEKLDAQLDLATASYVTSGVEVDHDRRQLVLPITFRYYQVDFGDVSATREFLRRHMAEENRPDLERAFEGDYAVSYKRYDWSLNTVV